jgi:hypothetical protein
MRTLAQVPPMILDERMRTRMKFIDDTGRIEDAKVPPPAAKVLSRSIDRQPIGV